MLAASRIQRWAIQLSGYKYDVKCKSSSDNANADGLSRLPLKKTQCESLFNIFWEEVEKTNVQALNELPQLHREEPKPISPFLNGKGDFTAFWTQFSLLSNRFSWTNDRQIEELILNCLRDETLVYVNEFPASLRGDIKHIHDAMFQGFGDFTRDI
ncbi:unnamed protein product [Mytilus coruscus]|uniref:Uncharacterized protein n=1 Tax=Mytilus coruscus TaxID=42192 RepID=A0A6J8E8J7_MYTCO|nr:unnamed protein product [Mytilus coruscus]